MGDDYVSSKDEDLRIDPTVNEVFLFHGTCGLGADKITTESFKLNLAGTATGSLYGRGIYLAENSTKSDEYSKEDKKGLRTMLVCRVALGNALYNDQVEADGAACEDACLNVENHSVLGDRKKCKGTFREFVVF